MRERAKLGWVRLSPPSETQRRVLVLFHLNDFDIYALPDCVKLSAAASHLYVFDCCSFIFSGCDSSVYRAHFAYFNRRYTYLHLRCICARKNKVFVNILSMDIEIMTRLSEGPDHTEKYNHMKVTVFLKHFSTAMVCERSIFCIRGFESMNIAALGVNYRLVPRFNTGTCTVKQAIDSGGNVNMSVRTWNCLPFLLKSAYISVRECVLT